MTKTKEKFVVYNLREAYHDLGRHEFKIVFNPKHFKNSHLLDIRLYNPDGREMSCEVKRWGRKISCSFDIDGSVSDGVAMAKILAREGEQDNLVGRIYFWVVKN